MTAPKEANNLWQTSVLRISLRSHWSCKHTYVRRTEDAHPNLVGLG